MSALRGVAITHRDRLPRSSRYQLLVKIASGGMATVYVGRLSSAVGITRLVAIKRAHAHLLEDPAFGKMLIAEARLATQIHHPNVVAVQTVEEVEGELLLVMDYVEGASLADLAAEDGHPLPARVAVRIVLDSCAGLHAAHALEGDDGKPLGIVHRDVSPHNILVGIDGIGRLTDFGIAKSSGHTGSAAHTTTGSLKGKVAYMAPEYVEKGELDARGDVFALGIVAWEALTRRRLFRGASEVESLRNVLSAPIPRPSEIAEWVGTALDDVVMKALARTPAERYSSAAELGEALEAAARRADLIASHAQVAAFVKSAAGDALAFRRKLVRDGGEAADTARGRYDEKTRAVLDGARDEILGRTERTASIGAASPAESTDVAIPVESTSTFEETAPAEPESSLGGGVSAHLVDEARRPDASPSSGRARRIVIGAAIATAVAGAFASAIPAVRRARASASASVETAAATTTAPPPTATVAPTIANASAPPTPAPSALASSTAEPARRGSGTRSAPPLLGQLAVGAPPNKPRVTPPPSSAPAKTAEPPPSATAEKAPPNPYAH